MSNDRSLERIVWRHAYSGMVVVEGIGLAAAYGFVHTVDIDSLNKMFPELDFKREYYSPVLNQWIDDGDGWSK